MKYSELPEGLSLLKEIDEDAILDAAKMIQDSRTQCPKCGYFKKDKSLHFYNDENGVGHIICYDCDAGPEPVEKEKK